MANCAMATKKNGPIKLTLLVCTFQVPKKVCITLIFEFSNPELPTPIKKLRKNFKKSFSGRGVSR
jgi:hypothetical protein